MAFVICGEALMDVFSDGDTPSGTRLDARVGGSPYNLSIGLSRLGQKACFLGCVSSGFLGDRLVRGLDIEGVDTCCVERIDAPTTLGLVGLDSQGVPSYSFYGTGAADRQLSPAVIACVPEDTRVLHFGSYAMVVEPVAATLRALIERESRGRLVAYDPNIRLNVEPAIDVWRATLAWMLPRSQLLKISEEDLALLHPGADLSALVQCWLAAGVALVVVTHGDRGASAWTSGGALAHAHAVPVQLVDTVGAGDTFQAALLTWLSERDALGVEQLGSLDSNQLADALQFAAGAAAITCSRRGADLPRRCELPDRVPGG